MKKNLPQPPFHLHAATPAARRPRVMVVFFGLLATGLFAAGVAPRLVEPHWAEGFDPKLALTQVSTQTPLPTPTPHSVFTEPNQKTGKVEVVPNRLMAGQWGGMVSNGSSRKTLEVTIHGDCRDVTIVDRFTNESGKLRFDRYEQSRLSYVYTERASKQVRYPLVLEVRMEREYLRVTLADRSGILKRMAAAPRPSPTAIASPAAKRTARPTATSAPTATSRPTLATPPPTSTSPPAPQPDAPPRGSREHLPTNAELAAMTTTFEVWQELVTVYQRNAWGSPKPDDSKDLKKDIRRKIKEAGQDTSLGGFLRNALDRIEDIQRAEKRRKRDTRRAAPPPGGM